MTYSRNVKRDLLGKEFVLGNLGHSKMEEVESETKRWKMIFIGQKKLTSIECVIRQEK